MPHYNFAALTFVAMQTHYHVIDNNNMIVLYINELCCNTDHVCVKGRKKKKMELLDIGQRLYYLTSYFS